MPDPFVMIPLEGDVLLRALPELAEALRRAIEDGRRAIVVNMERVRFCSCAAMGVLAATAGRLRSTGGGLRLVGPTDEVCRALRAAGLSRAVHVCDTVEDAHLSFGCQVLSPERDALLSGTGT